MRILIDGDSCNTIDKTIKKAKKDGTEVHIYCDTQHYIQNDYAIIHVVDAGPDAADFAIANEAKKGDIVMTNDGGLAAMAKAKGAKVKRFNGAYYTEDDIQEALTTRYFRNETFKRNKTRNMGSRHGKKKPKTIYVRECWC